MTERDEHIRVALRIKPAPETSLQNTCLQFSQRSLNIGTTNYNFDDILEPNVEQATVFSRVAERIVDGCLDGYNGTIFAYGQTGAGKTYTMTGYPPSIDEYEDHKGIIPRAAEHLFHLLNRRSEESKHINKSLTTLARVIRALSCNASHVPYRDGILTYLLTDSLSGNSRTSFIINVHQDKRYVETTQASAEFAVRLRTIKTNAEVNEDIVCENYEEYKLEISSLREEVARLKEDLDAERENAFQYEQKYREYKNENSIMTGDFERMEKRYKDEIESLRFQIQQKEEEQSDQIRIAQEVMAQFKNGPTALIESFADECERISKRFGDSVKESLGCQNKLDHLAVIQKELIDCATKFANDLEDGMHADPSLKKQARDRKSRRVTIFAKPRPKDRRVSTLFATALMEENEEELAEDADEEKENDPIPKMKKMTKDKLIERVQELVSNNNELETGRAQILAENKALDRHIKEITNELRQVKKQLKRVDEFRSRKKERSQTPKKNVHKIFANVFDETQDIEQLKRDRPKVAVTSD